MSIIPAGMTGCRRCERLASYLDALPPKGSRTRADYVNGPVPGFGDHRARVCLVGLAPGAHGANHTGRPFTGDGAGDFMYPLLHRAGFSNQAEATGNDDGLQLSDLYIANAVKCAPPQNKPTAAEFNRCRPFLQEELAALPQLEVVILLGQGAFTSYLRMLKDAGIVNRLADYPFAHGAVYTLSAGPTLVASYHTSRYNVQTGRMTAGLFLDLLTQVRALIDPPGGRENG